MGTTCSLSCCDRLAARVDLKADRAQGRLRVIARHFEPWARNATTREALDVELAELARWLGLRYRGGRKV
jgi:uncharacterized protein YcaQ